MTSPKELNKVGNEGTSYEPLLGTFIYPGYYLHHPIEMDGDKVRN